jgi:hypothetical protein
VTTLAAPAAGRHRPRVSYVVACGSNDILSPARRDMAVTGGDCVDEIGAGEGNRTLDTQLGKLAHSVESIHFFCKPGPLAGHSFQWFSFSVANRVGDPGHIWRRPSTSQHQDLCEAADCEAAKDRLPQISSDRFGGVGSNRGPASLDIEAGRRALHLRCCSDWQPRSTRHIVGRTDR